MPVGVVTSFDDAKGFGEVTSENGATLFFHCTAIADGTRTIAVGTEVRYDVAPGGNGTWEARALTPR